MRNNIYYHESTRQKTTRNSSSEVGRYETRLGRPKKRYGESSPENRRKSKFHQGESVQSTSRTMGRDQTKLTVQRGQ